MRPPAPDPLPAEFAEVFDAVRPRLGVFDGAILYYATTGSTNDVVAALAAEGAAEGLVVVADAQTAGRGRRGRTWFSPPQGGLYVSVLLRPGRGATDPARATALLTLTAGVAIAEGVHQATGLAPDIKWPNDLLVGRRKLAGILAEGLAGPPGAAVRDGASGAPGADAMAVVLGFGLNVSPAAYPPDLAARVTSLESELGRPVDRAAVCAEALAALARRYASLRAGEFDAILDDWRRRAPGSRGARVRWDDAAGPQAGITAGIDAAGALLVQSGDGLRRLTAGEVLWD